jgi:ABC-type phosphate transport system substrate-binding protein
MKRILLLSSSFFYLTSCYEPSVQESKITALAKSKVDTTVYDSIKVAGSTTMLPILESVANYFYTSTKSTKVIIDGTGSNEGLAALWNDSADIAMSSHKINDSLVAIYRKKRKNMLNCC